MGKPKAPRWTPRETAILIDIYPREGLAGAADALADRSWQSIYVRASKLGLRSPVVTDAPKCALQGEKLNEAVRLRVEERWSFARIAATVGGSEAGVCNAVMAVLCVREGHRPAARDANGRLLPAEFERLRLMLRKGLKGIEIQLRMGISAGRIAEERRRYNRELKANGKALLPPPGGGVAYSGVKVPRAKKLEVERLFMTGLGAKKIEQQTGVSNTVCGRLRNKLVARLRRKGEALPGCDLEGVRHVQIQSSRFIPADAIERLRGRLLDGQSVRSAGIAEAIGLSSAYRIRDELAAEVAARGETLPVAEWRGRKATPAWMPPGIRTLYRFRELCAQMPADQAKSALLTEVEATRRVEAEERRLAASRPLTFEEKLARVRSGEVRLTRVMPRPTRALAEITYGGVASGAL